MKNITLEMIDEFMEATGMDFESARAYLLAADGEMDLAIEAAKSKHQGYAKTHLDKLMEFINDLIKQGQLVRIVVRKDDRVKLDIPVGFGVVGVFFAKFLSVAAFGAALLTGHNISLEKKDGEIVNVKDMLDKAIDKAKATGEDLGVTLKKGMEGAEEFAHDVKDKVKDVAEKAKKGFEEAKDDFEEDFAEAKEEVKEAYEEVKDKVEDKARDLKDKAEDIKEDVEDKAKDLKDKAEDKAEEVKDKAKEVKKDVEDKVEDIKEKAEDKAEEAKDKAEAIADDVKDAAKDVKKEVKAASKEVKEDVKDLADDVKKEIKK